MKPLIVVLIALRCCNLYSQKITCDDISKYSLNDILYELTTDTTDKYTIGESKCFGRRLSEHDSVKGNKRILTYSGPFSTGCLKCLYHKFGIDTYDFAPDDLSYENVDAFMDSYNSVAKSFLSVQQKKEIDSFNYDSDKIFSFYLTAQSQITLEKVNDSICKFKIHSEPIDDLFQSDTKYIKIEVGDSLNDPAKRIFNYWELKAIGIPIRLKPYESKKILVTYNLEYLPDRYDLCWCNVLDKRYGLLVPVKNK